MGLKSVTDILSAWGSEHFSAKTQKAHIDLLRDAAQLVEKENASLKKEVAELKEQLAASKETVRALGAELREKAMKTMETGKTAGPALKSAALEILKALSKADGEFTVDAVANHFKLLVPETKYHLKTLENLAFVRSSISWFDNTPDTYSITDEGRAYLFDNGLQ